MTPPPIDRLRPYLSALRDAFARGADKHVAHARAQTVLGDMAASREALTAVLEKHLTSPGAFDARHYPVVALDIETNPHFGLVANCWIPLPDRDTDMSTKAIHHHGQMLLTTVTAFGPGYEHWTFTTPRAVDEQREVYTMRLLERAPHPLGHAAFVDAYGAHVPFYPASLTITLALWSSSRPTTWKDGLKRVPVLHKYSTPLRRIAASAGFARMLDLKVAEYFDFFPAPEGFRSMKDREEFGRGPNEDYLHSLFHILQQTGNESLGPLARRALAGAEPSSQAVASRLLDDLDRGRPIAGRLSPGHYGVPHANFRAVDIQRALDASSTNAPLTVP